MQVIDKYEADKCGCKRSDLLNQRKIFRHKCWNLVQSLKQMPIILCDFDKTEFHYNNKKRSAPKIIGLKSLRFTGIIIL